MKKSLIRLSIGLVLLGSPLSALAAPKGPKAPKGPPGSVLLPADKLFVTGSGKNSVICGKIKNWEPGKLVGKGKAFFLSNKAELGQLKKLVQTSAVTKKTAALKKKMKTGKAACANGPQDPVGSPNPTPTATPTATPDYLAEKTTAVTVDDVNHLYRRAGLGVPTDQAMTYVGGPIGPLVDYFMTYNMEPAVDSEARRWLDEDPNAPDFPQSTPTANGINMYALRILMKTSNQFHERLALLALHDRLATSERAVDAVQAQRKLMIDHLSLLRNSVATGLDYAKLLEEIGEDGVMVRWLTLDKSVRTAPNEDYARELMELFSLDSVNSAGQPNYTNDDIIQIAKAFTGWNLLQTQGEWRVIFTPVTADTTPNKIIFAGTAYQGSVTNGRDVVKHILANHPNAPISAAKWIAREYVKDGAPEGIVNQLGSMVKANNYVLIPVFAKLFKSEEFYKAENQFAIAKTPVERFVHLVRIMDKVGMPYDFPTVRSSLAGMGCVLTQTDTVFGCDKLEEIPDGQRLLNSANLITSLSNNNNLFTSSNWNYTRFFPAGVAAPTVDQTIDSVEAKFGLTLPISRRAAIRDYMNNLMNNNGTIAPEAWNPANAALVRRKVAGLFRIYSAIPQIHDLR